MSTNPAIDKASKVLSEGMDKSTTTFVAVATNKVPELTATTSVTGNSFKFGLFHNGVELGWLGKNSEGWATITSWFWAVTLEQYPYEGVTYYRIEGTNPGRYLSVSNDAYIGFYDWGGATGFTWEGSHLKSDYNGQKLSYDNKENGFLTAWDAYAPLDIKYG